MKPAAYYSLALCTLTLCLSCACNALASDSISQADAVIESINGLDNTERTSLSSITISKALGSDLIRARRSLEDKESKIRKDSYYWVISFKIEGKPNYHSYLVTKIVDCLSGELVSDY